MSYQSLSSIVIAIANGDQLVGQALELALRSAGYDARLLEADRHAMNGETNPIEGVRLVLIAPRSSEAYRKSLLERLRNGGTSEKAPVPVLELVTTIGGVPDGGGVRQVLWPCRMKDLKREIEAALPNGA